MPETITRIEFWRRSKGLTFKQLGALLETSAPSAQRYCLPQGDKNHRRPDRRAGHNLFQITKGLLHSDNFHELVDLETGEAIEAAA